MYSVCDSPSHSWGATDPTDSAYKGNQSRNYYFLIMTPSFGNLRSTIPKSNIAWNSCHLLYIAMIILRIKTIVWQKKNQCKVLLNKFRETLITKFVFLLLMDTYFSLDTY